MKKGGYVLNLIFVFCLCMGFAFTVKAADTVTLPVTIDEDWGLAASLVCYINEQRLASGLPAYIMDESLTQVAMDRAAELCVYYRHLSASGNGNEAVFEHLHGTDLEYEYHSVGENIAVGFADAAGVYQKWVNSSTHVGPLKSTKYEYCGVGVTAYGGARYWVLVTSKYPLGNSMNSAGVSGIQRKTHNIETCITYLQPYRMVNEVFYGNMHDEEPIRSHNIGDQQKIACGYIVEDPKYLDVKITEGADVFSVDELGHVIPKKVGQGTMEVSIGGSEYASIDIKVVPQAGSYYIGETGETLKFKVSLEKDEYKYTGQAIEPKPVVTDWYGNTMTEGKDYYLLYTNNTEPTTNATVSACPVVGGNYDNGMGIQFGSAQFTILPPAPETEPPKGSESDPSITPTPDIKPAPGGSGSGSEQKPDAAPNPAPDNAAGGQQFAKPNSTAGSQQTPTAKGLMVRVAKESVVYTGKAQKPKVTVYFNGKKLASKNYQVSYKNNKAIGTATVTVKGKGTYKKLSAKSTFQIRPKATVIQSLRSAKKKQLTVKWKKNSGVSGYQIQYGTKSSFKDSKQKNVPGAKKASCILSGLKSKKTYYVRVRTYKTVRGKKYYSAWSKKKSVRIK